MSAEAIHLTTPLSDEGIKKLSVGDVVAISGVIYTARDAAHKRMVEMLDKGESLPFDPCGAIVYYAGPSPASPGHVIGSVGPTTSGRMDAYSPRLMEAGLRAMIGKGLRSADVIDAIVRLGGIYFAAIGGAAALIARSVRAVELVAFEELGTEAIRALAVENFPAIVAIDSRGNDIYRR